MIIALFFCVTFLLGIVPGYSLPTVTDITWIGYTNDSSQNAIYSQYSNNTFYPYGVAQNEGFLISILMGIFIMMGVGPADCLLAALLVIFSIGFFSLIYVLFKLSKSRVVTLIVALLFYISPYIAAQITVIPVFAGILISPLGAFIDYIVFQLWKKGPFWKASSKSSRVKYLMLIIVTIGIRFAIVGTGWYTGVMSALCSIAFFSLIAIWDSISAIRKKNFKELSNQLITLVIFVILPWIIALGTIASVMPPGTSDFRYGSERFYGSSLDVATLLHPNQSQFVSRVMPSFNQFANEELSLTGDPAFWGNYIGYAMLVAVVLLIFFTIKNKRNLKVNITLIIIALVMLALSLGPVFKMFEWVPADQVAYDFPIPTTEVKFPWAGIYDIFPFSLMRTVYRWFGMFQAIVILLLAIALGELVRSKKHSLHVIALVLAAICIIEFLPYNPIALIESRRNNYLTVNEQLEHIHNDLNGIIDKNSVVALGLSAKNNNNYLASVMIAGFDSHIYSGSGDKAVFLSTMYTPNDIRKLTSETDPDVIVNLITLANAKNLCDYVLLPYYDMHKDVYTWPPDEVAVAKQKAIADNVEKLLADRFPVFHIEYYTVFKMDTPVEGSYYDLLSDDSLPFEKAKEPFLGDKTLTLSPESPLVFYLDASNYRIDRLYSNFYAQLIDGVAVIEPPEDVYSLNYLKMTIDQLDSTGKVLLDSTQQQIEPMADADLMQYIKYEIGVPISLHPDCTELKVSLESANPLLLKRLSANLYDSSIIIPSHYTGWRNSYTMSDLSITGKASTDWAYCVLHDARIHKMEDGTLLPAGTLLEDNQVLPTEDMLQSGIQFGPYVDLPPGKYQLNVNGTNLDKSSLSIYTFSGGNSVDIDIMYSPLPEVSSSICMVYEFEITDEHIQQQNSASIDEHLLYSVEFSNTPSTEFAIDNTILIRSIDLELLEMY